MRYLRHYLKTLVVRVHEEAGAENVPVAAADPRDLRRADSSCLLGCRFLILHEVKKDNDVNIYHKSIICGKGNKQAYRKEGSDGVLTPRSPRLRTGQCKKAMAPSCATTASSVLLMVGSRRNASRAPPQSSRHAPTSASSSVASGPASASPLASRTCSAPRGRGELASPPATTSAAARPARALAAKHQMGCQFDVTVRPYTKLDTELPGRVLGPSSPAPASAAMVASSARQCAAAIRLLKSPTDTF